jgi:hypothetical protein
MALGDGRSFSTATGYCDACLPCCDSGLSLPVVDGRPSLHDGVYSYGRTHCGYVVRSRITGLGQTAEDISELLRAHIKAEHPAWWADLEYTRAMSADG